MLAGGEVFARAFTLTEPAVAVEVLAGDGERFSAGQVLATVSGPARGCRGRSGSRSTSLSG